MKEHFRSLKMGWLLFISIILVIIDEVFSSRSHQPLTI